MRDLSALNDRNFDLLVIGGGINGAAIAWDAALRGLSVVLIEKDDFGSGASAAAFKIVHGGLRYLQQINIPRVIRSAREQRTLRRIAPHMVYPLPFLVPCYGWGRRSRGFLGLGATVYDILSIWRNLGVSEGNSLPWHETLSKEQCLAAAPGLNPRGLSGGVAFYDCQMASCERLTYSVIQSAVAAGAAVYNYVEAEELVGSSNSVERVRLRDRISGRTGHISARVIVNATGSWAEWLLKRLAPALRDDNSKYRISLSKGFQLVIPQLMSHYGLAIESNENSGERIVSRGNRSFFVAPWRGMSLLGTTESVWVQEPDRFSIEKAEVEEFLAQLRNAYSSPLLTSQHIRHVWGGLRPTVASTRRPSASNSFETLAEEILLDHATDEHPFVRERIDNLLTVIGVKFTTFRSLAERTVNLVTKKLGGRSRACSTESTPIHGGDIKNVSETIRVLEDQGRSIDRAIARHLAIHYGSCATEVVSLCKEDPKLAEPLVQTQPVIGAEIVYAARVGMVEHLTDIVLRRTALGTLGYPGRAALLTAAAVAQGELGWSRERTEDEIHAVEASYSTLDSTQRGFAANQRI